MLCIVGNKDDLDETVNIRDVETFAKQANAFVKKTSAKSNFGIESLF